MKKCALLAGFLLTSMLGFAQLNMTLISNLTYDVDGNDIWGWVDPDDGTEYAIMGIRNGTSVVSLADPANPEEVYFVSGANSTWRDIKVWGNYAFITCDSGADGLLVIDLSDAPNSYSHYFWTPNLPGLGTLETCHNLWIDEYGYCYLVGCNLNSGGMIYLDVFSTPGTPIYAGVGPAVYAHDVYVYDNKSYNGEIYLGALTVYDVSDKANTQFLGSVETPYEFTHNTWLNEDKTVCFTTDERQDAPVAAYDISDPTDMVELDQFRPLATLGLGVIPHNVTTIDDWLVISYYTDGCIVADAFLPDNIIETGNFDTFSGGSGSFNGVWGVYPYLPSGLVLVSDINTGLYVFEPNYVRACYLEGTVTDGLTGNGLTGVDVEITALELNATTTDLTGEYKTGVATAGTYEVHFNKLGYTPVVETVTLENGILTELDVVMEPIASLSGNVVRDTDGNPVPGAAVVLASNQGTIETTSNGDGTFIIAIEPGDYDVFAGQWGYFHLQTSITITGNETVTLELEPGYQDDFIFDLDWEVTSTASSGDWELVEPSLSTSQGVVSYPDLDIQDDLGDRCYVTGNGGNGGSNDVDDGVVTLTSPVMDLSSYNEPIVSYNTFFYVGGGTGTPVNDTLNVKISNGLTEVIIEQVATPVGNWNEASSIALTDYIELTDNMRIAFEVSDLPGSGHIVESAVDAFLIVEGNPNNVEDLPSLSVSVEAYPNPSASSFQIQLSPENTGSDLQVVVKDVNGRTVERFNTKVQAQNFEIGAAYAAGTYFVELQAPGFRTETIKLVKIQ
ncbi:MAG: choice-of-anchor B family protein [Phaeodactylibacter sp.]|nr:choice-of-anchor B family protein [Phaeodactylibacter sp.]